MGSMTRRGTIAATTGLLVIASLVAGLGSASANPERSLSVRTFAAPVWLSNSTMRVQYVVDNTKSQTFCQPANVALTWASSGGHWHHRYEHAATTGGLATGTFAIPGRTIWPGTLRYKVTVTQNCGLFVGRSVVYHGQSPITGYSRANIR